MLTHHHLRTTCCNSKYLESWNQCLSVRLEYKPHMRHEHIREKLISFAYYPNKQCIFKHTRERKKSNRSLSKSSPYLKWMSLLISIWIRKTHKIPYLYPHSYLDLAKSTLYTDCSSAVSFSWCTCVLRWGRDTWSENSQDQMYVVWKS